MKNKAINTLLHSVSSTNTANKFKSIMNSPNFGNQQILLQSCCFFDSERSQTPHPTNSIVKDFSIKVNKKSGSPKQKLYHYKKLSLNINNGYNDSNKIISKNDVVKDRKEENALKIKKLKKDNKALKETIKNLTSQLDRVCSIAETAKNNEINTLNLSIFNEKEKNSLLNKIENLTKEKEDLKKEIEKKEEEYNNYKINNKIEELNNKNKIIDNEKKHRKFISELSSGFENIKQMNNELSITVNKEINDNKKYKLIINNLNQENEKLKKKIDEQINICVNNLKEKLNEKEKCIQSLIIENNDLKKDIKSLREIERKYEDIYKKNIFLNDINNKYNDLIKENKELNNKLKILENKNKDNHDLSNKLLETEGSSLKRPSDFCTISTAFLLTATK